MAKSLEQWKNKTLGQKIDLDNGSLDCVDVPKSWAEYLEDKPWQESLSWGNAKDLYDFNPGKYWNKIERGNRPELGDIAVMNGQIGGGFGHTGVVVGIDGGNMTIFQQDTFKQVPVYTGVFSWNASYIRGFLRPKAAFTVAAQQALQGWQRQVIPNDYVNYREAPNVNAAIKSKFDPNAVADFKGFVRGQVVEGNDIWFVGRYTGGYAWSGGFTDKGTHDLTDMTPAVVTIGANQRQIAGDVMNCRKLPVLAPDNVIRTYNPAEVVTFDGWKRGQDVDGNNVWFRVAGTGGFIWSGGFTDSGTHDLPEITDTPAPAPTTPVYPAPTNDPAVTAVYNKKRPLGAEYAPTDLVNVGNAQMLRKEAASALMLMQNAAAAEGAILSPASGYRSYATQQTVYAQYVAKDGQAAADTYSARPGYSEHQTGLTMDFAPIDDAFKIGAASRWLVANAYKYGWVLRYPAEKVAITGYVYEPWHWRYVGVDAATDMHDKGVLTLEEYYNVPGGDYPKPVEGEIVLPPADPETPATPPEPAPPVPEDEASASARAFVARVASQLAAASVIVVGISGLVTTYTGFVVPVLYQGIATFLVAAYIIYTSQKNYKLDAKFKWPF